MGALHRFEDVPPRIRRLGCDSGAEQLAASKYIGIIRFFALFTDIPYRYAAKAERTNRTAADGTRTTLIQAGLSDTTLEEHGERAEYRYYSFGALVLARLLLVVVIIHEQIVATLDSLCAG